MQCLSYVKQALGMLTSLKVLGNQLGFMEFPKGVQA